LLEQTVQEVLQSDHWLLSYSRLLIALRLDTHLPHLLSETLKLFALSTPTLYYSGKTPSVYCAMSSNVRQLSLIISLVMKIGDKALEGEWERFDSHTFDEQHRDREIEFKGSEDSWIHIYKLGEEDGDLLRPGNVEFPGLLPEELACSKGSKRFGEPCCAVVEWLADCGTLKYISA
jgi:hypothetical protein